MRKISKLAKPITIQGVRYPSRAAAARALGVTPGAIYHAIRFGNLDAIGSRLQDTTPQPVTIRGVRYESLSAAARAIGVTAATVRYSKMRGTLDTCGMGQCCPVQVGDREFPSQRACAAYFGVSPGRVCYLLQIGRIDELAQSAAA